MSSMAPDRWAGTEPPSPPPATNRCSSRLVLFPSLLSPQSRLQEPLLGPGSPRVLSHWSGGMSHARGWGAPPASPSLPVGLGSQAAAGGEPRNYPNYSLASAAVASAATPSQERPRPRPERGNRRALRPGRRLRRGEPVRPPAWEAVMTDKPGRLAALARLITGRRRASSRGSFQVRSPSAPRPVIRIPTPGRGVAGRGGPNWLGKPRGQALLRVPTRHVPIHSFTHPLPTHSFTYQADVRGVCGCLFGKTRIIKNPSVMRGTWVQFLSWEDPLEKGKATHSSILA